MLTRACRIRALQCGQWQRSNGEIVAVRRMHPAHLVNALLAALAAGEPRGITDPLAAEVVRRKLTNDALREAEGRERQRWH